MHGSRCKHEAQSDTESCTRCAYNNQSTYIRGAETPGYAGSTRAMADVARKTMPLYTNPFTHVSDYWLKQSCCVFQTGVVHP